MTAWYSRDGAKPITPQQAAAEFLQAPEKVRLSRSMDWLGKLCQALGQSGRGSRTELSARIDVQGHKHLAPHHYKARSP